ncbi:uncharacterized protein PFL1_02434 [Pseudozyma flocculosa PF-1]|nr:uncharacterized protein PFL1_02434 [Pseudozyma flocculosa PF-1]EPQ29761.1 hypothetical protein PFL1_02434 [Pseudozyma flocculosa PF-1]
MCCRDATPRKCRTWLRDDKGREDGVPPARPPAEATTTTTTTTSDVVGRSEEAGAETEDTTATTTAADSTLASTAAMTAPLFGPSGGGGSGGGVGASLPDAPPQAAAPTTAAAGAPVAPPGAMGATLASTTATGTAPKVGEQTTTQPPTTPTAARPNISTATTTATTTTTARAATQAATPPLHNHFQSNLTVVPPLNFDMISPGVYRSGHPNERNFGFLKRLNLKSVMYLANEEYRTNMTTWAQSQGIRIFHFRLDLNKEPLAEMDSTMVTSALLTILDPRNLPMLIHCNKGKYRVGCMAGLLRRLQGWSHTSIFEEYARFAGSRIADTEFIEVFDLSPVYAARINAKRSSSAAAAASSS